MEVTDLLIALGVILLIMGMSEAIVFEREEGVEVMAKKKVVKKRKKAKKKSKKVATY